MSRNILSTELRNKGTLPGFKAWRETESAALFVKGDSRVVWMNANINNFPNNNYYNNYEEF